MAGHCEGPGGGRNGELVFNESRVSVWENEKALDGDERW